MSKTLDFESIDNGNPIDGLSIPALTRVTLARFAGAVDDYNAMHLDDKVAVATGKNSVFAPTNLVMAYVGRMVQAWLHGAVLRRFDIKVVRLVWPGDVLTCRGIINDKRHVNGECVVEANVWADNQRGENVAKGLVVVVVQPDAARAVSAASRGTGILYHPVDPKAKSSKALRTAPAKAAARKSPAKRRS